MEEGKVAGSISTMGIGSGLELQDIIDQLRDVDKQLITRKENEVEELEVQLQEFTTVKNKVLTMKSHALDLSLSTTFLSRSISSSDEDVITATVSDATTIQSTKIDVTRLATISSYSSTTGAAESTESIFVPTLQKSTTGVADKNAALITSDQDLVIAFGDSDSPASITVSLTNGMTLDDGVNSVVDAINNDAENTGYVTASSVEVNGEFYLNIESTAGGTGEANRVMITQQFSELTLAAPDRTFAYSLGDETITVDVAADTTMDGLVTLINDATDNPGVTASVIDNGDSTNPYQFILQSDSTGEDNRISLLATVPDLALTDQGATSLNSLIEINGISYQRQSNTVTDVISGVSLTLKDAGASKSSTLAISRNDETIKDLIIDMVGAFNEGVQEISKNVAYDEDTEEFGNLAGTTLRDLPFDFESLLTTTITADSTGKIKTLFDLGLEFNRGGTELDENGNTVDLDLISINEDTLSSMLSAYPDAVEDFFLGDSDNDIDGMGDIINDRLRSITLGTGQIEAEKTGTQEKIDTLEDKIESETARLTKKYDLLAKQFVALDQYMNQMTSISTFLTSQFEGASGAWGKSGK
jgi:flagellar hook-associated protein 2